MADNMSDGDRASGLDGIVVLEGLDAVRHRPNMYIGPSDDRLGSLLALVLGWAVSDDVWGGRADHGTVTLGDGWVRVDVNGCGFPVAPDRWRRVPLTYAFTSLMTGNNSAGVLCLVTAFSHRVEVESRRDGFVWRQAFENDVAAGPLVRGDETSQTGTTITFWPNEEFIPMPADRVQLQKLLTDTFRQSGMIVEVMDER